MLSSIRVRILLSILLFEVIGYGALGLYNNHTTKETMLSVRKEQLDETFSNTLNGLNHLTDHMESVATALATTGARMRDLEAKKVDTTPEMEKYLVNTFMGMPDAIGGGLWFEPYTYKSTEKRYGPYVAWGGEGKDKKVSFTWDLNTEKYDYHNQSWYRIAIPADKDRPKNWHPTQNAVWTEPYKDEAGTGALMITVDAYVYDDQKNVIGLSTVDWSLAQMQEFIKNVRVTEKTAAFLIDGVKGLVVADRGHPELAMQEMKDVPWLQEIVQNSASLQKQQRQEIAALDVDGIKHIVYYTKSNAGMIFGIRIPLHELAAEADAIAAASAKVTAGISIFFIIVGAIFLHMLFQPFKRVVDLIHQSTSRRDEKGELVVENIVYTEKNEFREIIGALNEMTDAINARDARLAAYAAGLEAKVEERTAEITSKNRQMKLVFDTVNQGLLTVDLAGRMVGEHSAAVDRWLGTPKTGEYVDAYLGQYDSKVASWVAFGLQELAEGGMPAEVTIEQMPHSLKTSERDLRLDYEPIYQRDAAGQATQQIERVLVVVSDETEVRAAARREEEQRENMAIFERIMQDKAGFISFVQETSQLVENITQPSQSGQPSQNLDILKRQVHTLKGNAAIYGMHQLAAFVHSLEDRMIEEERGLLPDESLALAQRWREMCKRLEQWLGNREQEQNRIEVDDAEYRTVLQNLLHSQSNEEILAAARRMQAWSLEPTSRRLARLSEQAVRVAQRLAYPAPQIYINDNHVRLDAQIFGHFWSSLIHVVRNAVDHGIGAPDARERAGKSATGRLYLHTLLRPNTGNTGNTSAEVCIEVQDDGAGIQWEKLAHRAAALGLPHTSIEDLKAALFADNISTKDEVSDVSGRGVGMSAVKQACEELGGYIEVESEAGKGTCFRFIFPLDHVLAHTVARHPAAANHDQDRTQKQATLLAWAV